jgi:hypothetical protein
MAYSSYSPGTAYTYTYTYIHTYIHTHTHTHIHTYTHTHIHTYTYIHTHIHTHHAYIPERIRSDESPSSSSANNVLTGMDREPTDMEHTNKGLPQVQPFET